MGDEFLNKIARELVASVVGGYLGSPHLVSYTPPRLGVQICEKGCTEKKYREIISELKQHGKMILYGIESGGGRKSVSDLMYGFMATSGRGLFICVSSEHGFRICPTVVDVGDRYIYLRFDPEEYARLTGGSPEDIIGFLVLYAKMYVPRLLESLSMFLSKFLAVPSVLDYRVVIDRERLGDLYIYWDLRLAPVPLEYLDTLVSYMVARSEQEQGERR